MKSTFFIALIKNFRMIYDLLGFAEFRILPLVLVMTSLTLGFEISIFCTT